VVVRCHREVNETYFQCFIREVREEVGCALKRRASWIRAYRCERAIREREPPGAPRVIRPPIQARDGRTSMPAGNLH
jgi:hypothetical protein